MVFIFSISSYQAKAQIFDSNQSPPGLKWMQINSPAFQLLYPIELKDEAQRMANTIDHMIASVSKSLGKQPRKITIILQNQGVVSNGFVQLAPRRSEFFTTPPQSFDMQDWLNSLALHELRHVVQFDKLTGSLKRPFFEELALGFFGVTLPPWFFEGDAVGIETTLSHAGRGRLPEWETIFRTNTLSNKYYSYSKNYLGSFKDLTPGYYQLGFFMTSKLKRDYGKDIMDSVMSRISKSPLRPYNLSRSIKHFTGLNSRMLHDSTIAELDSLWTSQDIATVKSEYTILNKRTTRIPGDYSLPIRINSPEVIALRTSLDKTPRIVKIDSSGKETNIIKIGLQTESNFNYSARKLVWDEFRYDKRYQKRSYNVINLYDLDKNEHTQLTHKSRLFSPNLSPDGKTIATIQITLANKSELIELDSKSGKRIGTFKNDNDYILQTPSYSNDGNKIVCVAVNQDGTTLIEFDRLDGSQRLILPFQRQQISRPIYAGELIVFRAHYNGIDNIYAVGPGTNILGLTSVQFGATNPSYNNVANEVLFNTYQNKGLDIGSISLGKTFQTASNLKNLFIAYAAPLVQQESDSTLLDSIPRKVYQTKTYNQVKNLFYFHSLSPIVEENEFNKDLSIGFKLKSNNQLNTLDFYTGYQFNYGLKKSEYLAGFTFKRYYPVVDIKYINQARLSYSSKIQGVSKTIIPVAWREDFLQAEIKIPFIANRLNQTFTMGISGITSYTSRYDVSNRPARFANKIPFPIQYKFYFTHNTQRSIRDIAPRWGQNFNLSYQSLPLAKILTGDIFRIQSSFFTPGFFANHSLQTSFNYQKTAGIYQFNVEIPRVSGYSNLTLVPLRNTLLLDYRLPLFYPDAEIGTLAYVKRIRGGFFADFENIGKGNRFEPKTYGLELNADLNLLRFYLPNFVATGKLIFVNQKQPKGPLAEFGIDYNF